MNFTEVIYDVDETRPLIYMWVINNNHGDLLGRYVGKAKAGAKRPRNHYSRNVANLLASKPYRKKIPDGYRKIHSALADAQKNGFLIRLYFLCNVQPNENINEIEQWHIKQQNSKGPCAWQLNG